MCSCRVNTARFAGSVGLPPSITGLIWKISFPSKSAAVGRPRCVELFIQSRSFRRFRNSSKESPIRSAYSQSMPTKGI